MSTLGQGSLPTSSRLVGLEPGVLRGSERQAHRVLYHRAKSQPEQDWWTLEKDSAALATIGS